MTRVSYNRAEWYSLIFIGVILIPALIIFVHTLLVYKFNHPSTEYLYAITILIAGFTTVMIWTQLLFLPFQVVIDESAGILTVKFLLRGKRTIHIVEIESYSSIVIAAGKTSTKYNGVLIHLKNNRLVQCSDFNLRNYKPIVDFLEYSSIDYLGNEMFRYGNYYIKCLK